MSTGNDPAMAKEKSDTEMEEEKKVPRSVSAREFYETEFLAGFAEEWDKRRRSASDEQVSNAVDQYIQDRPFIRSLPRKEWRDHYVEHLQKAMGFGDPMTCEYLKDYHEHQLRFHYLELAIWRAKCMSEAQESLKDEHRDDPVSAAVANIYTQDQGWKALKQTFVDHNDIGIVLNCVRSFYWGCDEEDVGEEWEWDESDEEGDSVGTIEEELEDIVDDDNEEEYEHPDPERYELCCSRLHERNYI